MPVLVRKGTYGEWVLCNKYMLDGTVHMLDGTEGFINPTGTVVRKAVLVPKSVYTNIRKCMYGLSSMFNCEKPIIVEEDCGYITYKLGSYFKFTVDDSGNWVKAAFGSPGKDYKKLHKELVKVLGEQYDKYPINFIYDDLSDYESSYCFVFESLDVEGEWCLMSMSKTNFESLKIRGRLFLLEGELVRK